MRLALAPRVLLSLAALVGMLQVASGPASGQMTTGSYSGDGSDNRSITGVGFLPDLVIVASTDGSGSATARTSTMSGDASKDIPSAIALEANRIQSFVTGGFTVGNHDAVNKSGGSFRWIAFKSVSGEFTVSSYSGNGSDNRSISVGFQPDFVIVISASGQKSVMRSSAMSGDTSFQFEGASAVSNRIQAIEANGFQVGNDAEVNENGSTYHWAAWSTSSG